MKRYYLSRYFSISFYLSSQRDLLYGKAFISVGALSNAIHPGNIIRCRVLIKAWLRVNYGFEDIGTVEDYDGICECADDDKP